MRALALFFACYLTLLGCLPCTDAEACAEPAHVAIVRVGHHDYGPAHGGVDWCSPLCQCHCCAGFALPTATVLAFVTRPVALRPTRRFARLARAMVPVRTLATPWQPPRLRA